MATIGRPKTPLVVTEDERQVLVRLTTRARVNRSLAFRARLVLARGLHPEERDGAAISDDDCDRGQMASAVH